jgi:hypothetical protein
MIDVKKLTASFLALAAVAGFVAFLITNPDFYKGTVGANLLGAGQTPIPSNAFVASVEATPLALRQNLGGGSPNLTTAAAENVAQVILALNPYGPQQFSDGTTGFIIPTTTLLTAYVTMESPSFDLSSLWTSPSDEMITPAATTGVTANQQYADAFRSIMKNTINSSDFIASAKSAATTGVTNNNFLATAAATFGAASQQLRATPVPAPFVQFDQNFLAYLDDQQTALAVIANNGTDPLKSMIVLNSGDQVQQQITGDFASAIDQYQSLDVPSLLAESQPPKNSWMGDTVAFANSILNNFSIPTAMAQSAQDPCKQNTSPSSIPIPGVSSLFVPVTESTLENTDAAILKTEAASLNVLLYECDQQNLAQGIKKNESDVLTQTETNTIQNGTSGNSRVITDYAQYSQDAALRAGTLAYKKDSAAVCPQFQSAINAIVFNPASTTLDSGANNNQGADLNSDNIATSTLGAGGLSGNASSSNFGSSQVNGTGSGCALTSQNSSGDFNTDPNAWTDYLTDLVTPSDNSFGSLIAAHDDIDGQMAAAAAGAQTESVANQGYKSQVSCVDSYVDSNGNTICDQTRITTPGSVNNSQLQAVFTAQYTSALTSSNPSSTDALLANSLGMQLQKNPNQGLTGLLPQTADSLASICNSLAPPGTNSGQNPAFLACNSTAGKLINDYDKYEQLAQNIGSYLNSFSNLLGGL